MGNVEIIVGFILCTALTLWGSGLKKGAIQISFILLMLVMLYNPYNWDASIGGYSRRTESEDESFLFSLTNDTVYRKNNFNTYSTYNTINTGAVLGGDLRVFNDLRLGSSNLGLSYGDSSRYQDVSYQSELAGAPGFHVDQYETFTVAAFNNGGADNGDVNNGDVDNGGGTVGIPEPSTLAIFALSLFGLTLRRVKKSL